MVVKQTRGRVFGAELTAKERKALEIEVHNQVQMALDRQMLNVDVLILHTLHTEFGFGEKRLRQFYEAYIRNYKTLLRTYQTDADVIWAADQDLKQIGVDVSAWNREDNV